MFTAVASRCRPPGEIPDCCLRQSLVAVCRKDILFDVKTCLAMFEKRRRPTANLTYKITAPPDDGLIGARANRSYRRSIDRGRATGMRMRTRRTADHDCEERTRSRSANARAELRRACTRVTRREVCPISKGSRAERSITYWRDSFSP